MRTDQKDALNRLATIDGHLKGIRKMIEEDAYCVDILKQTYAVGRAISKLEEVETANVNLATEKATIRFVPDLVGYDEVKKAVEKAGYGVGPTEAAVDGGAANAPDREAEQRAAEIRDLQIRFAISLAVGI